MIERIIKNNLNQTCKIVLTHEDSLSSDYKGPIRGKNAPKLVWKYFDMVGLFEACEKCSYVPEFCKCDDLVRDVNNVEI